MVLFFGRVRFPYPHLFPMSDSLDEFTDDLDILLDDYERDEVSREKFIEAVTQDVKDFLKVEDETTQ